MVNILVDIRKEKKKNEAGQVMQGAAGQIVAGGVLAIQNGCQSMRN